MGEMLYRAVDEVPDVLRIRTKSLHAFGASGEDGRRPIVSKAILKAALERLYANSDMVDIHAHYAKRGCYAALIDRP